MPRFDLDMDTNTTTIVISGAPEGTCVQHLITAARQTPKAEAATPAAETSDVAFPDLAFPKAAFPEATTLLPVSVPGEPTRSARSGVVPDRARGLRWLPLSFGKQCPRCGGAAPRTPTVWYARGVRLLLRRYSSTRMCVPCDWKGLTLHRK